MKHRRTREIVIELTSLLDVVMILIFAVLLQNSQLIDKKNQEIAGIESENMAIKGDLDELLGEKDKLLDEKDKLLDEKDKLQQELQDALEKIESGRIDEYLDKIDKLEDQIGVLEAINDYVFVYYINVDSFCHTEDESIIFDYSIFSYGELHQEGSETKIKGNLTDEDGNIDPVLSNLTFSIYSDINESIDKALVGNIDNKYYYVVMRYGDIENSIYKELVLLKNKFTGKNHLYCVLQKREDK